MNKVFFNLNEKDNKAVERYEIMEFIALTNDSRILDFVGEFLRLSERGNRRKRTRAEREQRAVVLGLDSFNDVTQ